LREVNPIKKTATLSQVIPPFPLVSRSCVFGRRSLVRVSVIRNSATPSPATSIPEIILSISSGVGSVVGGVSVSGMSRNSLRIKGLGVIYQATNRSQKLNYIKIDFLVARYYIICVTDRYFCERRG